MEDSKRNPSASRSIRPGIAVSKLAVADLQDPQQSLIALLREGADALERFLTQPIDSLWDTGVIELAVEALRGIVDLCDLVEAAPAPRDQSNATEGVFLELSKTRRHIRAFIITLVTFADLGRLRADSLTFQDWCEVRRDAFDLSCVLETLEKSLGSPRRSEP